MSVCVDMCMSSLVACGPESRLGGSGQHIHMNIITDGLPLSGL